MQINPLIIGVMAVVTYALPGLGAHLVRGAFSYLGDVCDTDSTVMTISIELICVLRFIIY